MEFEVNNALLFSDTLVPDVFINEYLPTLPADQVKLYIYILFLSSKKKKIKLDDLCAKLCMQRQEIEDNLLRLESVGLVSRQGNKIMLSDLKEKELLRLYRPKNDSRMQQAFENTQNNRIRNQMTAMINNRFFQGLMSSTWFTEIDSWYEKFGFDEDVMYQLFQECYDRKAFTRSYIFAVAQSWATNGVKNASQLEQYLNQHKIVTDIKYKVAKKLKRCDSQGKYCLNEIEGAMVEKWVNDYKYDMDVIDYLLKRTTRKANVGFDYLDAIVREWHKADLRNLADVQLFEEKTRPSRVNANGSRNGVNKGVANTAKGSFDGRGYDKDYIESLYEEL